MYTYEHYNFRVLTLLLGLMAFMFLMYAEYFGASISLVLGIVFSFSYTGVSIDTKKQRYIKYDRFTKLRIGRWEALPKPSYVTLVRIKLSNLVVEGDRRFIAICRGEKEKMTQEALKLGKKLDIRVLDYTTHEKKWIL